MSINHDPSFGLDHDPTTVNTGVFARLRQSVGMKVVEMLLGGSLLTGATAGSCSGPASPESKPDRSISATPKPGLKYTVVSGDTLSEIVADACPKGPDTINNMVIDMQMANGLSTPDIHAGQQVILPADLCEK